MRHVNPGEQPVYEEDSNMSQNWSRRRFLGTAAGTAALSSAALWFGTARAQTSMTAVEWGGDVVEAMKQIAAAQKEVEMNWVLFQGGAGSILPKIKTSWPNPEYDYVAGWEGSFNTMVTEDWLETVTTELIPNLADIPEALIIKDSEGNWKAVPRAVGGIYLGYRKDTSPMEITSIDDLFSPELKRMICWPGPTQNMMLQIVALALHGGGDENNMEPGWELMTELARSGNIGRIAVTDSDFTNSLTSGETAVGFFAEPGWTTIAENFDIQRLTKTKGIPTFLYQSGFAVLKNRPNTEATLAFIDHAISPEMNTLYAEVAGEAPLNSRAKSPAKLAHLTFTSQEMSDYVHVPDFSLVLAQQDAWTKRWESDIAPLL